MLQIGKKSTIEVLKLNTYNDYFLYVHMYNGHIKEEIRCIKEEKIPLG